MKILTPEFRVSYPSVFKPKRNDLNNKDEYTVQAIFPKGADLSKLKAAVLAVAEEKWGKGKIPKGIRDPFRKHEDREKKDEKTGKSHLPAPYEAGGIYLNLKSNLKPAVVKKESGAIIQILDETEFYAGCWAIAEISIYAYDQAGNKGVGVGLNNILKVKDGEPLGGRSRPEDAFAAVEVEETGSNDGTAAGIFG